MFSISYLIFCAQSFVKRSHNSKNKYKLYVKKTHGLIKKSDIQLKQKTFNIKRFKKFTCLK